MVVLATSLDENRNVIALHDVVANDSYRNIVPMLRITTTRKYRATRPFLFYSVFPINNRVRSEHLVSFRCFMRKINISAVMKYIITINIHIGMMSEQIRIRPENTFRWCVLLMENKSRFYRSTVTRPRRSVV